MQTLVGAIVAVALSLIPAPPAEAANFENPIFAGLTPEIVQDESKPEPIATPAPEPERPARTESPANPALSKRLACIRAVESDTSGGYRAVSPSGNYRGAYQADRAFWLTFGGSPALAGRHELASPAEQDQVAARGLAARGTRPWPPARHC